MQPISPTKVEAPSTGAFSFLSRIGAWRWVASFFALLVLIPLGVIFSSLLVPDFATWQHLIDYVLFDLIVNTLVLCLAVGIGVTLIGVTLAWLTAVCEFPGRKFFSWALVLPLAIPAYVSAFVLLGIFDFTGPLQQFLGDAWLLPNARSAGGLIIVMILALYPYVYLLARNAFLTQGKRALEIAQTLGRSEAQGFFSVSLPLARPWIIGGLSLAIMEVLADFGTVSVFNYDTFTTAIYKTWFSMFSIEAAAQLASLLTLVVLIALFLEYRSRMELRHYSPGKSTARIERIRLSAPLSVLAWVFASVVWVLAFLIPVIQLAFWAADYVGTDLDARYWGFLSHSLMLAGLAAALITTCALLLAYARRKHNDVYTRTAVQLAILGYALPGAVIAVGIFIPVVWLDGLWRTWMNWLSFNPSTALQGTLLIMLLAYLVRFLAVAYTPVDSAMQRITQNIDDAARSLGVGGFKMLRQLHVPILRGGLFSAALLIFIEVMKEMPITLMTRPFGWDTLSIRIFEMTSEGQWEQAALPALALILAGLLPIMLLTRQGER